MIVLLLLKNEATPPRLLHVLDPKKDEEIDTFEEKATMAPSLRAEFPMMAESEMFILQIGRAHV